MSRLLAFFLILGLAGLAFAVDTGNRLDIPKVPLPFDPNQGDGREGGETIETAVPIPDLPYTDTGNTCDNINDYDEACPYTGSTSSDVVYYWVCTFDGSIDVDLYGSTYDTKTYVYDSMGNLIACNDDYYPDYVSLIENCPVMNGETYYIVIDGYDGACGQYVMDVTVTCAPPPVECPDYGVLEGEPPLVDYYIDNWNGGCNATPPVFQPIHWVDIDTGGSCGSLCGVSGWYYDLGDYRDTDWFSVTAADFEMSFEMCADYPCNMFVLNTDCDNIILLYSGATDLCFPCATITWPTNPGDQFWLWVGPEAYSGPVNEFNYLMTVCGHVCDVVPVEVSTWGAVKGMYR